jgi:hypothetical protein
MTWSNSVPPDLAKALDEIARYREAPAASDVWAVLKDWLERNGVEPPQNGQIEFKTESAAFLNPKK